MDMDMGIPVFVYIELAGSIIGMVLLLQLSRVTRQLGGEVGAALRFLLRGVSAFTLAFVLSFVIDYFGLSPMQSSMTLHMILMTIAMVLVVFSAIRFARLV